MRELDNYKAPLQIICLTEESVETLFELGVGDQIIGVSAFVKRPSAATKIPKVSFFTTSNLKKIIEKKPDLILGFSDIQKDIAKDLIELGQDVWISNHRSISGILKYIKTLSLMVDRKVEGEKLLERLENQIIKAKAFSNKLNSRPKVYFEEWDDPQIVAIEWVSEVIELCGGINISKEKSRGLLAKERFTTHKEVINSDPDIIFACHCGKKVKLDSIYNRDGYSNIKAIKNKNVFELEPEIFLQPGPAVLFDGIDILIKQFEKWSNEQ
jgi:iron complex transport system substrate-binding protein